MENSPQPIEIKLSKKINIFFQLFTAFLKPTFNFNHFDEKDKSLQNFKKDDLFRKL